MNTLAILALGDVHPDLPSDAISAADQVWTLNDFYRSRRVLRILGDRVPERIYNMHANFRGHEIDNRRFADWHARYREYESRGSQIVGHDDMGFSRQRVFPLDEALKEWPAHWFSSSLAYMIFDALFFGPKPRKIVLVGTSLSRADLEKQGFGLLENIRAARAAGVEVVWPWERWAGPRLFSLWNECQCRDCEIDVAYGSQIRSQMTIDQAFADMEFGEYVDSIPVLTAQ